MKKIVILIIFVIFLCSCSNQSIEVGDFSYEEDLNIYLSHHDAGIKTEDFKNTKEEIIDSAEDVIKLAKKEVTISYNQILVDYDKKSNVWKVNFSTESEKNNVHVIGGDQTIYLDKNGITLYIRYGE